MTTKEIAAFLVEVVTLIKNSTDGITGTEIKQRFAEDHPQINEKEREKILTTVGWWRSTCKKVGWLRYNERTDWRWFITEAGDAALKQYTDPLDFLNAAKKLTGRKTQLEAGDSPNAEEKGTDMATQAVAAKEATATFQEALDTARESIEKYLLSVDPYVFQDIVADLLRALGYHVDWTANKPGPDGGCDIVAFSDAIGVTKPIIKVQVKRKKDKEGAPNVKSFYGNLGQNDSGIYVCLGGFTPDAEAFARNCQQNLTLIRMDRFVQLWIQNYDKLTDEAKSRFRLEPIYYVRPETE